MGRLTVSRHHTGELTLQWLPQIQISLNSEYKKVISEIDRQAANVGLVSGGSNNGRLSIYMGGGSNSTNAKVSIDLSGAANQVDSTSLGLSSTNIAAAGTALTGNNIRLDNAAGDFTGTQDFT